MTPCSVEEHTSESVRVAHIGLCRFKEKEETKLVGSGRGVRLAQVGGGGEYDQNTLCENFKELIKMKKKTTYGKTKGVE